MRRTLRWTVLPAAALALLATTTPAPAATSAPAAHTAICTPLQTAALQNLQTQLDKLGATGQAGKAQYWGIDPATCTVRVAVLRGATDPVTTAFIAAANAVPGLATVTYVDSPVTTEVGVTRIRPAPKKQRQADPTLDGGSTIYSGTSGTVYKCTAGFNTYRQGSATTAGHCGKDAPTWYDANDNQLGTVSSATFPGADWSVISPTSGWSLPNDVLFHNNTVPVAISGFATPTVGETVSKTGATTGTTEGTVQGLNQTVNYGSAGVVNGLIYVTISSSPGDSGGPLFSYPNPGYQNVIGLGILSGGNGTDTFFQPLNF